MDVVPDVVTHYYLPGRRPFLNLSDLPDDTLSEVLVELTELRRAGKQHRPFGPRYMGLRHLTERKLRDTFIERGGRPERTSPHYFVLGESSWYSHLAQDMQHIQIPLVDLPPEQTTITYPDSFVAMEIGLQFGLVQERKPYHGHVFLIDELDDLVSRHGLVAPPWEAEHASLWTSWPAETFIEVQVWSDDPIHPYLG